jgi:hypothetical protein
VIAGPVTREVEIVLIRPYGNLAAQVQVGDQGPVFDLSVRIDVWYMCDYEVAILDGYLVAVVAQTPQVTAKTYLLL